MCDVHLFILRNKWLTKPFCSTDRREHTQRHTHNHTLPHSGRHVFCTACHYRSLDVVPGWHWCLLLSFYDNFHSLAPRCPASLPLFLIPSPIPVSLHPIPPPPNVSKPTSIFSLLQWDACLFLECKPSWHISPEQSPDVGICFRRGVWKQWTAWSPFAEV